MIGKKLITQRNAPLFEVKEILTERSKEGELRYEQTHALEYSKKFAKITPSKAEKMREELSKIEGLDDDFISKALDILPTDIETAKLLSYKAGAVSEDALKQTVEIATKYAK